MIGIYKGFRNLIVIPCMKIVVTQNLSNTEKIMQKINWPGSGLNYLDSEFTLLDSTLNGLCTKI